ncbi:MAG: GntR family transcriptional regulator, partial [Muribaculaceae bacterium]|nr:GntR family transcriptional regulator [Muribaculaceae bacterium]MDE5712670.1 GntR family transcriptional regulator [Muribaculaceae bacterium]
MDFNENKPIYLQITDGIMDEILAEIYPAEGRLLSVREYAAKVEVNANTVMRAYDWLQQQKIIFNKRGIGFFVMPDARKRIIEMRKNIFFQEEASYFFGRLSTFGMMPEDLARLYSEYLSSEDKIRITNK